MLLIKVFEVNDVLVGDENIQKTDKNALVDGLGEDQFEDLVDGDRNIAEFGVLFLWFHDFFICKERSPLESYFKKHKNQFLSSDYFMFFEVYE